MSDQQANVSEARPRRGLLLWSLALNAFLICGIAAFLLSSALHQPMSSGKGGPAYQFERLASSLPAEDASVLRTEFGKKSEAVEEAHTAAHRTRDNVRLTLGAEAYDAEAARRAMSEAEAAHLRLDQLLQDVIVSAAAKMSPAGRSKLADWQPGPPRRQ
jgi:uncharacterized membrane protein